MGNGGARMSKTGGVTRPAGGRHVRSWFTTANTQRHGWSDGGESVGYLDHLPGLDGILAWLSVYMDV